MNKLITIDISKDELNKFEDFLINRLSKDDYEIRILEMIIIWKKLLNGYEK